MEKRCPECFLRAEKNFYCPCDGFNLFNRTNANLHINEYCENTMSQCVEEYSSFLFF